MTSSIDREDIKMILRTLQKYGERLDALELLAKALMNRNSITGAKVDAVLDVEPLSKESRGHGRELHVTRGYSP